MRIRGKLRLSLRHQYSFLSLFWSTLPLTCQSLCRFSFLSSTLRGSPKLLSSSSFCSSSSSFFYPSSQGYQTQHYYSNGRLYNGQAFLTLKESFFTSSSRSPTSFSLPSLFQYPSKSQSHYRSSSRSLSTTTKDTSSFFPSSSFHRRTSFPLNIATGVCNSPYSFDQNNMDKDEEEINRTVYKQGDTIYPVVPRAAIAVTVFRYKNDIKNQVLHEKVAQMIHSNESKSESENQSGNDITTLSLTDPEELEMLVIQRGKEPAKYKWSLVGGSIEVGEDSLTSAKREVEEETGLLESNLLFYPFAYTTTDAIFKDEDEKIIFHYVIGQYTCLLLGSKEWEENQVHASDDAIDYKWVSFDELPNLDLGSSSMVTTVNTQLRALLEKKMITMESLLEFRKSFQ